MAKAKKLTDGMRQVLADLAAGREARHSLPPGRSAAGGFEATLGALKRRGLIDWQGRFIITDAGRAAIGVPGTPAPMDGEALFYLFQKHCKAHTGMSGWDWEDVPDDFQAAWNGTAAEIPAPGVALVDGKSFSNQTPMPSPMDYEGEG